MPTDSTALIKLLKEIADSLKVCFVAGTPTGHKNIEDFRVGDLILSRNEFDPNGPLEAKTVEEIFSHTGRVAQLHHNG